VGFFDLETSNLNANWGIILSYCILGDDGVLYKQLIKPKNIFSGDFDKNVCTQFCEDARKFDRLIGWYSERFDAPYARTRCLYHNLDFPIYKEIKHTDAWRVARNKLKLHSNRLGVVAPFFGIAAKDHPLNPNIWLKCLSGNQEALDFVLTHNIEDVESLKKVWHRIEDSVKVDAKSL
jgi:uncharacterized protein YprB with RNaseH-like and TPR domain